VVDSAYAKDFLQLDVLLSRYLTPGASDGEPARRNRSSTGRICRFNMCWNLSGGCNPQTCFQGSISFWTVPVWNADHRILPRSKLSRLYNGFRSLDCLHSSWKYRRKDAARIS